MKISGVIIDLFNTPYNQGCNLTKLYKTLNIPLLARIGAGQLTQGTEELLPQLHRLAREFDGLVIGYGDSEFYVVDENRRLLESFREFGADLAFGDGYPAGTTIFILRPETLPVMENIRAAANIAVTRSLFDDIIHVDVNTFDIDNIYPELMFRSLRLSFYCDSPEQQFTITKLKQLPAMQTLLQTSKGLLSFAKLAPLILKNKFALKTLPQYYEFTITTQGAAKNSLFPQSRLVPLPKITELSVADYKLMLQKALTFSGTPVIGLGGCGEVTLHPDWQDIVDATLSAGAQCVIETDGSGLTQAACAQLLKHPQRAQLKMIFKLHGTTAAIQKKVTGNADNFAARLEVIEYYLLRNPQNSYVEAVKVRENVEHIGEFYDTFKRYTPNVLLGKYNHYRGALPERRDDPMQPFHHIDCWHLKRDVVIDAHGNVWVCKQDFKNEHSLGNLITDSMENIFAAGQNYYEKHLNKWDFCKHCDEGYTYNF